MLERLNWNAETARRISVGLKQHHLDNATAPLRPAGDIGSWADAFLLHREALTLVVDANVLRNDILYACRNDQRTTLITAANTGALRIYVAEHVIREVERDANKWCEGTCNSTVFRRRFANEYLPRFQVIPDGAIPLDILTSGERARVEKLSLSIRGKNDVPSVLLSLALGAPFLSQDTDASEAVYAERRERADLERWRDTLAAGSDASELAKWQFIAMGTPVAVGFGIFNGAKYLYDRAPTLLAGLGVGALLLLLRDPKRAGSAISSAAMTFLEVHYEISRPYEDALARFRSAAPAVPELEDLHVSIAKRAALLRACLRTLAHAPQPNLTAHALTEALPPLGVAQSAPIVRELLRTNASFSNYGNHKWRVGCTFSYSQATGS